MRFSRGFAIGLLAVRGGAGLRAGARRGRPDDDHHRRGLHQVALGQPAHRRQRLQLHHRSRRRLRRQRPGHGDRAAALRQALARTSRSTAASTVRFSQNLDELRRLRRPQPGREPSVRLRRRRLRRVRSALEPVHQAARHDRHASRPGYSWLDSATIGATDLGMFDPVRRSARSATSTATTPRPSCSRARCGGRKLT